MEKMKSLWKIIPWLILAGVLVLVNIGTETMAFASAEEVSAQTETQTQEPQIPAPTERAQLSAVIQGDQIQITGTVTGEVSDPAYYDNYLYLFELKPYEDDMLGRTDYTAWITKGEPVSFSLPLQLGTKDDRLYSRFILAVYDGKSYTPIGSSVYVTNPEALAKNTADFKTPQTKKGLLIEQSLLSDAMELGVKHVIVNIPFHHILGEGIEYEYDGKTYHFNKTLIEEYDNTISTMCRKDILVTAVILNGWNDATPQLIHPNAKKSSSAYYYGFNASTQEGYETIKAIASFLADRYSGNDFTKGKISNWIIGNEINNNKVWNYMGEISLEDYVWEYERAFRVFYTAIKSINKNDRVYFSTDYNWNDTNTSLLNYSAKDIVDEFNYNVRKRGQMDWGLAYHPYSIPLTEPEFWDDDQTGLIQYNPQSNVINFKNLSVLTDYFQQPEFLMTNGEVRPIILSEQGFTSKSATRGTDYATQAAAIAYAYYIADSNPHIDAFIMSRQVDAVSEVQSSLAFGLWECDMNSPNVVKNTWRKKAWSTFRDIDKKSSLEETEFAKKIIGIEKWSDVIPNFKWAKYE